MSQKKNKKATPVDNAHEKGRFPISVTWRFWIWAAVWIGALIYTQALRAPASNIFFGFVSIIPWASLVYALLSKLGLKVYMLSDTTVTKKNKPFSYEFRLINESILPYPFIDAYIKLPRRSSVRTTERCVRVGMPPNLRDRRDLVLRLRFLPHLPSSLADEFICLGLRAPPQAHA